MKVLEHPKGPTWIWKNGMDVNLGGSGAKHCSVNNGLTSIQEDKAELGEDDVIQVASVMGGAKGKKVGGSAREGLDRIPCPLNWPFSLLTTSNLYGSPVKKMTKRTRFRTNQMMIDPSVDKQKRRNVHTALAKGNHTYPTIIEDLIGLPIASGSQDVLNACLTQASLE
jgi:hypothetical protein